MHSLGDKDMTSWSIDMEANLLTMSNVLENWVDCSDHALPHNPNFYVNMCTVRILNGLMRI